MKKVLFLGFFAILILGIAVSCNKDFAKTDDNTVEKVKTEETYSYMADYDTYQVPVKEAKKKIAALQELMASDKVQMRSAANVSVSEAVWDIEALSNAAEGHASWQYDRLKLTTHYLPLPTTTEGGQLKVSNSDVATKYNAVRQLAQQDEAAMNLPQANSETVLINISPVSTPSGELMLEVVTGVGYGLECIGCLDPYMPVCRETTNCWRAAYKLGTCNTPASGPQSGIDATDVLEGFINSIAQEGCPLKMSVSDIFVVNPQSGYFVNVTPYGEYYPTNHPNPNDPIVGDGYRDHLLFRTSAATPRGYNDCLSISDMNFYRDGAISIMRAKFATDPTLLGKYVAYSDFKYTLIPSGPQNVLHTLKFWAGNFVQ